MVERDFTVAHLSAPASNEASTQVAKRALEALNTWAGAIMLQLLLESRSNIRKPFDRVSMGNASCCRPLVGTSILNSPYLHLEKQKAPPPQSNACRKCSGPGNDSCPFSRKTLSIWRHCGKKREYQNQVGSSLGK